MSESRPEYVVSEELRRRFTRPAAEAAVAGDGGGEREEARWPDKAVTELRWLLKMDMGALLIWVRDRNAWSCRVCETMDGEVRTARDWIAGDLWPGHHTLCGANCKCKLEQTMVGG